MIKKGIFFKSTSIGLCFHLSVFAWSQTLVVVNQGENSVQFVNAIDGKTLSVFDTYEGPHEVAISPKGDYAVVSNYGIIIPGSTITVFYLKNNYRKRIISLNGHLRPHGLVFVSNEVIAVSVETYKSVLLVDIANGSINQEIPTEAMGSHMLTKVNDYLFSSNIFSGSITRLSLVNENMQIFNVIEGIEALGYNRVANILVTASRTKNMLYGINPTTGKILYQVPTEALPFRIASSKHTNKIFVSNAYANTVSIHNVSTGEKLVSIPIASRDYPNPIPANLVLDSNEKYLFVSCMYEDVVAKVDLEKQELVDYFKVGKTPDGIAYINK